MTKPRSVPCVMVIDDKLENLRLLSSLLDDEGFDVRPVSNGHDAIAAATAEPPDLLLLDINMPHMNGYEVCARLRQINELAGVPIIFLTALDSIEDKIKAFAVGGVDYITKPFQIDEVLARVRTQVALGRARAELAASYQRLTELETLRENLVHMVVHDMRSPLMRLLSCLGMLEGEVAALGSEARQDLSAAVQAAEALRGMANDLLDVSRLEASELPLTRTAVDVAMSARDVRAALAVLARRRAIEIVAPAPVIARCDAAILHRVLENLVGNAIHHTPPDGAIRIAVTRCEDRVRVEVADEGPGVPRDARQRIFEKFATLAHPAAQGYRSVGLGLAFCKLAIEAHRGTIGVDDGVHGGSVFWFELPA